VVDGVHRFPVVSPDWLINARINPGGNRRTVWQAANYPSCEVLAAMSEERKHQLWSVNEYQRVLSTVPVGFAREDDLPAGLRASAGDGLAVAA